MQVVNNRRYFSPDNEPSSAMRDEKIKSKKAKLLHYKKKKDAAN